MFRYYGEVVGSSGGGTKSGSFEAADSFEMVQSSDGKTEIAEAERRVGANQSTVPERGQKSIRSTSSGWVKRQRERGIFFKKGPDSLQSVFGSDRKY